MPENSTHDYFYLPVEIDSKKTLINRSSASKKSDNELIQIFWSVPMEAFFGQNTIALIINKSIKTLESDRWRGSGIPYRKVGGHVLYKKRDVIDWIESHELIRPEKTNINQ